MASISTVAHADSTNTISNAPGMPPAHGMVANSLSDTIAATRSMTDVPHPAIQAKTYPHCGISQDMNSAASPAMVANPTTGPTSRFAGTEARGSCGSIRICIGRVSDCAAMVMASGADSNRGSMHASQSVKGPANSTMPNTAAQDNAKP